LGELTVHGRRAMKFMSTVVGVRVWTRSIGSSCEQDHELEPYIAGVWIRSVASTANKIVNWSHALQECKLDQLQVLRTKSTTRAISCKSVNSFSCKSCEQDRELEPYLARA
jgi:hypothetical protein